MFYKIYRYLAEFFLERCGFLPTEIKRVFATHLVKNIPTGEKFCIAPENIENSQVSLQEIKEICSSVEYSAEEDLYNCIR